MNERTKVTLALVMFACLTMVVSGLLVQAAPPRPATFYGTVKVNGVNPPSWVVVEAQIGGVTYATTPVQVSGADMVYALDVPGDMDLPGKQGGEAGDTIQFRVGGLLCAQTYTWQEGAHVNLNLTATGSLPTATPTDTLVLTDTPTITPTSTNTPEVTTTPAAVDLDTTNTTVRDTYISEWDRNKNYGSGSDAHRLKVYRDAGRTLIHFDISSAIPTNSTVTRATLYLYHDPYDDGNGPSTVRVYRVLQDWSDVEATWNERLDNIAWYSAGCNDSQDREQAASAAATIEGAGQWYTWDIRTLVQDWVWDPGSNKGMILTGNNWHDMRFHASDYPTNRPHLYIEYTAGGGPVLTPTTVTPTQTPSTEPTSRIVAIYGASDDAHIDSAQPDTVNLSGLRIYGVGQKRCLLDFDVLAEGIPADAEIISATLRLTTSNYDDHHPDRFLSAGAYLVRRSWRADQVTWRVARTGESWSVSGCEGAPDDRDADPVSVTVLQEVSTGTRTWERVVYEWEVGPIVQAWLDEPDDTDGLILISKSATYRDIGFWDSSFMGDAGRDLHPRLIVHWQPGVPAETATPTPTQTPVLGAVHGIIYNDVNENGVRDFGEVGAASARVQLLIGSTRIAEYVTGSSGEYTFTGLTQGSYTLQVFEPAGYRATTQDPRPIYVMVGQTREEDFGVVLAKELYLPVMLKQASS